LSHVHSSPHTSALDTTQGRPAEFDFRYSNRAALEITDEERRDLALQGITGKRLTYRRTGEGEARN
jgi:hypothetical protein